MSEPQHPAPTAGVRLELKGPGAASGHVDGAWWPRSRDLRRELPDLVAEIGARFGPVERVAFGRLGWDPIRRGRLATPTGRVALDEFTTLTPDTAWFVVGGRHRRRLGVVVIPPDTSATDAAGVLQRASAPDNAQAPAELLRGDVAAGTGVAA